MYNHEPQNYICPLCAIRDGIEGDYPYTKQADIVYRDKHILAVITSHWWPTNKGHVLIFPTNHVENLYDIDDQSLTKVQLFAKKVALAFKELYKCDGVTVRQNNEKPGDQDVWHYHVHVFPRYVGDNINQKSDLQYLTEPQDRVPFAQKLKEFFSKDRAI